MARKSKPQALRIKLQSMFDMYQNDLLYRNLSPRTVQTAEFRLGRFLNWLAAEIGHEPLLDEFSNDSVQRYTAWLRQKKKWDDNPYIPTGAEGLSAVTIQGHIRNLKAFSAWLYRNDHTDNDVLGRLYLPKATQGLIEPLTIAEIERLFATFDTRTVSGARDYTVVMLFLDAGLREAELCTLTLADVHLEQKPGYVKVMGKGAKERKVYLGRRCQDTMLRYRDIYREEATCNNFFVCRGGGSLTTHAVRMVMTKAAKAANIPRLHTHLLRHTSATQFLADGGDSLELQQRLGHTTLKMTSHYVHLADADLAGSRERVSPMDKVKVPAMKRPYQHRPAAGDAAHG